MYVHITDFGMHVVFCEPRWQLPKSRWPVRVSSAPESSLFIVGHHSQAKDPLSHCFSHPSLSKQRFPIVLGEALPDVTGCSGSLQIPTHSVQFWLKQNSSPH